MQSYDIVNNKEFMSKLLKSHLFDSFEVREIILHTSFKMVIDGKRNPDYFSNDEEQTDRIYLTWDAMRKYVYELIQGSKPPTYFKIILAASSEKVASLVLEANALYLNIQFKENRITCSTGVSYKVFTLDKEGDKLWDKEIEQFLFQNYFM